MPHPDLETSRLLLRPVTPEDYQAVFRWCGDPKVNKYMIYPLYKSAEAVRAWLESKPVSSPDEFDYGFVLKETGELIGEGGMFYHPEEGLWHIGYNLRSDLWGRGLTTEAVMRKLGLTFDRDSQYSKLDGSETFPAKTYRWERKE